MFRKNAWPSAALAVAAALGLAVVADASEPPSSKVARWHDEICPRDLAPVVTGPCYGYYPTRWRIMPPCDPPVDLVLPPTSLSLGQAGKPTTAKSGAGKSVVGPSPYGAPLQPSSDPLPPKAEWTTRQAPAYEAPLRPVSTTKSSAAPEKR